jgi:transposase-like protein
MVKLKSASVYYSESFKNEVLQRIHSGEMSAYQAGRHFGIKGSMTIYRWLERQVEINPTFVETNLEMTEKKEASTEESNAILRAELAALQKLLDLERLRSESYLTMIKLAEEKFGVPIEKKFGTKQSK